MASSAPESPAAGASATPAEAELALLRAAHQDLLRAISHDLRAPLRHITAFAPLLRELIEPAPLPAPEHAEALEFLGTMEQAGQRMGRMIDALLALSRLHAAPLRLETVDLQRLVGQLVDELRPAGPTGAIAWDIAPLPAVRADALQLRLLLKELLGNAIKFSRGQPAPRIAVSCTRGADGQWQLRVQDNGVGFDMAQSQACSACSSACTRSARSRAWAAAWRWWRPSPGGTAAACAPRPRRARAARSPWRGRKRYPKNSELLLAGKR